MAKTLKQNYARNVEIMRENIKRGMTADMCIKQIEMWRKQFEAVNKLGDDEKDFLNACLELVEPQTHMSVVMN